MGVVSSRARKCITFMDERPAKSQGLLLEWKLCVSNKYIH